VGSATPFTLTVTGSNFISTSQIAWNGSLRATAFGSSTQLTTQIVAADIATQGTANVSVVNPGPGGGPSTTKTFTITSTGMAATSPGEKSVAGANEAASVTAISGGSRYIAFVGNDASGSASVDEIFLRDTCRGAAPGCTPQTTLVSAALIGVEPDGASRSPSISADGRFVVFASDATNLTAGDNNGVADVFLRDTCIGAPSGCTPATSLVSIASDGGSANGASASPSISADGRFVSFDSAATNLVLAGAASVTSAPTDNATSGKTTDNSSGTVPVGAYLRDTCFGASGACTPSTARLATSSAPQ
jgi:Tol biopolymer transport system component